MHNETKGKRTIHYILITMEKSFSQFPFDILEEQVNLFIVNLVPKMMYELKIKSPSTIKKLIKKGTNIEEALIWKCLLKINKENNNTSTSNEKTKFWPQNKNVKNDGVFDA